MFGNATLSIQEFTALANHTRMKERAREAARRVLVDGEKPLDVAKAMNINHQLVYRAVARLNPNTACPYCGHSNRHEHHEAA